MKRSSMPANGFSSAPSDQRRPLKRPRSDSDSQRVDNLLKLPDYALSKVLFGGFLDTLVIIQQLCLVNRRTLALATQSVQLLDLHHTRIRGETLSSLALNRFPNTRRMLCQWCFHLDNRSLRVLGSLEHLKELSLRGCVWLEDEGVAALVEGLTRMNRNQVFTSTSASSSTSSPSSSHFSSPSPSPSSSAFAPEGLTRTCRDNGARGGWSSVSQERSVQQPRNRAVLSRPGLEELDLTGCGKITDLSLSYLAALTSLRWLSLCLCKNLSDQGLMYLSTLPELQHLDLECCRAITDRGIEQFASGRTETCKSSPAGPLSSLSCPASSVASSTPVSHALSGADCASNPSTAASARGAGAGGSVHLSFNTDSKSTSSASTSITGPASPCARPLVSLNLSGLVRLQSAGFAALSVFGGLRRLSLAHTSLNLSDMYLIIEAFPALEALDVHNCRAVNDEVLRSLAKLKRLRHLNVSCCEKVTPQGVTNMAVAFNKERDKERGEGGRGGEKGAGAGGAGAERGVAKRRLGDGGEGPGVGYRRTQKEEEDHDKEMEEGKFGEEEEERDGKEKEVSHACSASNADSNGVDPNSMQAIRPRRRRRGQNHTKTNSDDSASEPQPPPNTPEKGARTSGKTVKVGRTSLGVSTLRSSGRNKGGDGSEESSEQEQEGLDEVDSAVWAQPLLEISNETVSYYDLSDFCASAWEGKDEMEDRTEGGREQGRQGMTGRRQKSGEAGKHPNHGKAEKVQAMEPTEDNRDGTSNNNNKNNNSSNKKMTIGTKMYSKRENLSNSLENPCAAPKDYLVIEHSFVRPPLHFTEELASEKSRVSATNRAP